MKFNVTFPYIPDMGSVSPIIVGYGVMESASEQALWHLNRMRDHDGLAPLSRLPARCVFTPIESEGKS